MIEDVSVSAKEQSCAKKNQPELRCLLEILLKRTEKQFPRMGLLVADDFEARVVKCCRGGAYGENGQ